MVHYIRFALRTSVRHPLATGSAFLTAGLGVGANTAMVSVGDVLLLRSLRFSEADGWA